MGRAFNRLVKQVDGRRAERERFINYGARLQALETYLYEVGSFLANTIPRGDDITSTQQEVDFLASHEEYRHFLEKVAKQNG